MISANTPPTIADIGTGISTQGQSFSFIGQAADAQAGQTLTCSIVSGAPNGALLGAGTGLFLWTPPFLFASTTNTVTVMAADNGEPPLNDTDTFTLISLPPPPAISRNGNTISLSFQTIPGKMYRVEYKSLLHAAEWLPLGGNRPAGVMTHLAVDDTLEGSTQRILSHRPD